MADDLESDFALCLTGHRHRHHFIDRPRYWETAALILTAGSSLGMPMSVFDPARTMSVHLYMLAMEGISMDRAFGTAFLIIILILIINYLANLSLRKFSQAMR